MDEFESVYDIADAGSRQRFVVRDEEGCPLIVHNCENATQGTAREILMPAVQRVEDAGYAVVLTVYDEIVCEVPEDFGSAEELAEIMSQSPGTWAEGWPIKVVPWEGFRYKK